MSYNDDAVLAKLSALNETQESIVTVAQWVMFHRRHADRTGQLWLQRLKDSGSNKRLNLIYLANEVAQQSKARRKDDFLVAFSPVIAEATACAYRGATHEVQQKLRRVVEVWRARQIFELPIQDAIETRLDELDKTRSSNARLGGGSIFASSASSVPNELVPLVAPQQTISKLVLSTKTSVNGANQDYAKLTDPNAATPSPPVHAARLNGLLKTLANAEGAVAESIKARKLLIEGLEKILDTNRSVLASEEAQLSEISTRRTEIDNKKRDVEESIMRGFSNSNPATPVGDGSPGTQHSPLTPGQSGSVEPDRPEVEALTPPGYPQSPPVEPIPEYDLNQNHNGHNNGNPGINSTNGHGNGNHNLYQQDYTAQSPTGAPGLDLLSSLSTTYARPASSGSAKKRKLNDDEFPDLGGEDAMDGLDDEVVGILNKGL